MTTGSGSMFFAPLSPAAIEEFADARNFIAGVANDLLGGRWLNQTESDLSVLQAIVDHEAMKNANYEAWVALGIAFGDALAAYIPGLAWRLATDQSGTYAALQYEAKALSIAAPTMLWKRVERGEEVDLSHIAKELKSVIETNAHEYQDA